MKSIVHISEMSGKLEYIKSINTNTLTNPFCISSHGSPDLDVICKKCFSFRYLSGLRKNSVQSLEYNSIILSERVIPDRLLPVLKDKIFRFSSHGELININHLNNLYNICKLNPKTTFSLWSKRITLVQKFIRYKPDNIVLLYSNPKINGKETLPRGFDKCFSVYTKEYVKSHGIMINCTGRCYKCLKCYDLNNREKYIRELVK